MRLFQLAADARTRIVVRLVLGLVLMALVGAILHEALIFGVASHLRQLDIDALTKLIHALPVDTDEVHIHLVLSTLTAVRPRGIAVVGPPGDLLHSAFPSLFLSPTHAVSGAAISAVLGRGSSLPALFAMRVLVEMMLIAVGALCIRAGFRTGFGGYLLQYREFVLSWLAAFGLYLQAQATWAIIKLTPTAQELDYMGISIVVNNLIGDTNKSDVLHDQPLPSAITLVILGVGFSIVPVLGSIGRLAKRTWAAFRLRKADVGWQTQHSQPDEMIRQPRLAGFILMLALALILPTSFLARTNVHFTQRDGTQKVAEKAGLPSKSSREANEIIYDATPIPTPSSTEAPIATSTSRTATPLPSPTGRQLTTTNKLKAQSTVIATPTRAPTSTPIAVERSKGESHVIQVHWSPAWGHFVLTNANGELVMLRGVNYNTHYTTLPKEEHVKILRRDFAQMRAAGANLITGYATFNEVTLEVAQEYGIFVIMPYVLDLNGDYLDPNYRSQVKAKFTSFIRQYENYASLIMWNFDDEPVHNMQERFHRPPEQVQAFTDFIFELSEYAYETDRYHRPSWLKEPRDWYLDIFERSINKARKKVKDSPVKGKEILDPNRYVVMARSAYGTPLDIHEWLPKLDAKVEGELKMPFAIGEYGVVGMDGQDRGLHLAEIWSEAHDNSVLGSAVYTYGPYQPDPGDPTPPSLAAQLMLVDENGTPVDDAWERLSRLWIAQQAEEIADKRHSSIPLHTPEFKELFERYGGYPTSGPIKQDNRVRQFFLEGAQGGHAIAYMLEWDGSTRTATFQVTDRVIFEELGNHVLAGEFLKAYLERGGYAQFGAPISSPHNVQRNGRQYTVQEFAKSWTFVQSSR